MTLFDKLAEKTVRRETLNSRKDGALNGLGFGFESPVKGDKDIWLTPPTLLKVLGDFDLDPCFLPDGQRPWDTAARHICESEDGLKAEWGGANVRTFLNSPYGPQTGEWLAKLARHGNGIALVFARTETRWFQQVAPLASAMLFLAGRLKFHHADGKQGSCATAPSVLLSFDNEASAGFNRCILESNCELGFYVPGKWRDSLALPVPESLDQFPTPWVLHDCQNDDCGYGGEDDAGDLWRSITDFGTCGNCGDRCDLHWRRDRDALTCCPDCVTV